VRAQASAHGSSVAADLSGPAADGSVGVQWHSPQRRIAPGQSVVFYDRHDRRVLGGGIAARLER
jgi:tRNA-specific 2-thiouridylase